MNKLRNMLQRIDRGSYKSYKQITGTYQFDNYILYIDHAQGDPFASPSSVRIRMDMKRAAFPYKYFENKIRKTALADWLTRRFSGQIKSGTKGNKGSGKSGLIFIYSGEQEVLERTSFSVTDSSIELRIQIGLPAFGRRVNGPGAIDIFFNELPSIVNGSLLAKSLDLESLWHYIQIVEDQDHGRSLLMDMGLICFVGNGSILPRKSGIDKRCMDKSEAIVFMSPKSMEVEIILPHQGKVRGMGIKKGITLIVGGGYHGKSTLLDAIEMGVYNQIPGDGRELVFTTEEAVKIRAEDGRPVEKVDISSFINNLPMKKSTRAFCTEDASGSTSQGANIMEALECGSNCLLVDEDTSATNFLVRDARMQALVSRDKEPVTPFIDRVKEMKDKQGISTIMVIGGAGDYFEVADQVIMMDSFHPFDKTKEAKEIFDRFPSGRKNEVKEAFSMPLTRAPQPGSFPSSNGYKPLKIQTRGKNTLSFDRKNINLLYLEQLSEECQTRAIGNILFKSIKTIIDGKATIGEIREKLVTRLNKEGLEFFEKGPFPRGEMARPRIYEIIGALNRLRGLKINQKY